MKLWRALWRFARRTDGLSSLELVLLLFPMMVVVFGIIQFSFILYHYNQMENVARETARLIAVDDTVNPGANGPLVVCPEAAGAEAVACQMLGVPSRGEVSACYQQEVFPPDEPVFSGVVTITAPMDELGLVVDIMGWASERDLTARATMRVEPTKIGPASVNPPFLCDGISKPDY